MVDLNKKQFPNAKANVLLGLGLLEYVHDLPWLLAEIAGRHPLAILSYNPANPSASLAEREGRAWVNHLDVMAFEEKFGAVGFVVVERRAFEATQMLWKLRGK